MHSAWVDTEQADQRFDHRHIKKWWSLASVKALEQHYMHSAHSGYNILLVSFGILFPLVSKES